MNSIKNWLKKWSQCGDSITSIRTVGSGFIEDPVLIVSFADSMKVVLARDCGRKVYK